MNWINNYWKRLLASLLLISSTVAIANGLGIYLKAQLAQVLIEDAWSRTLSTGHPNKPWPWADTWPVARLQTSQAATDLYILKGAQGSSLAFGPGWLDDSVSPNQTGTKVIAGHRDTHFRFLQQLQPQDTLTLTNPSGSQTHYRVSRIQIIDSSKEQLMIDTSEERLILITCYPFEAINPDGPQRYIVNALPAHTLML